MNNEDMSEIIQKLSSMMNSSNNETDINNDQSNSSNDISSDSNGFNEDMLRNIFNSINSDTSSSSNVDDNSNSSFNFDINTILKMKNVMDKINSTKSDPRTNLLLSLKPYLNHNRKEKLDQYMQFLNISKVIEAFQSDGGVSNK